MLFVFSDTFLLTVFFVSCEMAQQQKSITFFFRKKREHSEVDENDESKATVVDVPAVTTTPKRVKTASNTPVASPLRFAQTNSNVNSPKTDEEKKVAERIEQNRLSAKMKLEGKATRGLVVDMGVSWYKALEKEFSKEYFLKVKLRDLVLLDNKIIGLVGEFRC